MQGHDRAGRGCGEAVFRPSREYSAQHKESAALAVEGVELVRSGWELSRLELDERPGGYPVFRVSGNGR